MPATSYGLAVAARNAEAAPGDRVVLAARDFPSNVHTWKTWAERTGAEVCTVERGADGRWTEAVLDAIDEHVRVVSVPSVHWIDGAVFDLELIGRKARDVGALLVVDATQSLGAMPLDLAAVRPDYLVAAGYKWLLGPLGVSYLYVAEPHREGRPLEENWANRAGAEDFEDIDGGDGGYRPGARRFDVGQRSNFVLTPMATAALEQLREWGIERVAGDLAPVTSRIEHEARSRGLEPVAAEGRGPHMVAVALPGGRGGGGRPPPAIRDELATASVFVELLGSTMRISPHLHTTDADVDRLLAALDRALG